MRLCGKMTDQQLISPWSGQNPPTNHQLYETLSAHASINYTYIETNGEHSWRTWRSQVPRLLFSSFAQGK